MVGNPKSLHIQIRQNYCIFGGNSKNSNFGLKYLGLRPNFEGGSVIPPSFRPIWGCRPQTPPSTPMLPPCPEALFLLSFYYVNVSFTFPQQWKRPFRDKIRTIHHIANNMHHIANNTSLTASPISLTAGVVVVVVDVFVVVVVDIVFVVDVDVDDWTASWNKRKNPNISEYRAINAPFF